MQPQHERVEIRIQPQPGSDSPEVELPAVITVVDSFDGSDQHADYADPTSEPITGDIAELMAIIKPGVAIQGHQLEFRSMDDFTPAGLIRQIPKLQALIEQLEGLDQLEHQIDGRDDLAAAVAKFLKEAK